MRHVCGHVRSVRRTRQLVQLLRCAEELRVRELVGVQQLLVVRLVERGHDLDVVLEVPRAFMQDFVHVVERIGRAWDGVTKRDRVDHMRHIDGLALLVDRHQHVKVSLLEREVKIAGNLVHVK